MPNAADLASLAGLAHEKKSPTGYMARYSLLEREGVAVKNLLHELDVQQAFGDITHEVLVNMAPRLASRGVEWNQQLAGMRSVLERSQKGLMNTGTMSMNTNLSMDPTKNVVELGGRGNRITKHGSETEFVQENKTQWGGDSSGNNNSAAAANLTAQFISSENAMQGAQRTNQLYSTLNSVGQRLESILHNLEQTHSKIRNMKAQISAMGNNNPMLFNTGIVKADLRKNDAINNQYKVEDEQGSGNKAEPGPNRFDISRTSSGCVCASACDQHQGQPFQWCRVDKLFKVSKSAKASHNHGGQSVRSNVNGAGTSCSVVQNSSVLDPLGYSHKLYNRTAGTGKPQESGEVWDYCVRQPGVSVGSGGWNGKNVDRKTNSVNFSPRIYTAHPGCECINQAGQLSIAEQMDFYAARLRSQYTQLIEQKGGGSGGSVGGQDFLDANQVVPLSKDGILNHIPLKDRFTAMIVSIFKAGQRGSDSQSVCRVLGPPNGGIGPSKGFAVCPVNPACLEQDTHGWTTDWFSKSKDFFHTWDFCSVAGWDGNPGSQDRDMMAIVESLYQSGGVKQA